MTLVVYDGLAALPLFNPDLDTDDLPVAVDALRREVGTCQGMLLAVPEYAHGLPGAFKNMLDWLVSSIVFPGTPIAIFDITPRAQHAQSQLREILATMAGRIIEEASISTSMPGRTLDADGFVADPGLSLQIRDALTAFATSIGSRAPRPSPCG